MITKFNFKDKTIKSYAIRKLTPFECFRLMGVRDDVIRTMQSTNAEAAERVAGYKSKGKAEDMAVSASQQDGSGKLHRGRCARSYLSATLVPERAKA